MPGKIERLLPPIGTFVEIDGARLHYVDRGEGPAIVMVHGLAGLLQNFTYGVVDRLAERFRVIALDRPGAGYSTRPRGVSASLPVQAATIARFVEKLGLERPLLVGHSLGGAISLAFALEHAALVRGLALIAPLTQPRPQPPKPFRPLFIRSPFARTLLANTVAIPIAMRNAPETIRGIFAPEDAPADFGTQGGALLGLRPSHFWNASADLVAASDDMPALARRYGEIALPTSVLFGTDDAILDYRVHGERLREQLPQTQLTLVPGGHMLPVTQPDLTATWLADVASARSGESTRA